MAAVQQSNERLKVLDLTSQALSLQLSNSILRRDLASRPDVHTLFILSEHALLPEDASFPLKRWRHDKRCC